MSGQEEGRVARVRSRGLTSENKFSTISLFLERNGNLHHCWLQWPGNAEMHRLLAESNRSQRYIDARWLNVHLIKSRPRPWHSFHRVVRFCLYGERRVIPSFPLLSTGRQISRIFSQTSFSLSEIFLHLCLPTDQLEQHSNDWFAILSGSDIIKHLFPPSSLTVGNSWSDC